MVGRSGAHIAEISYCGHLQRRCGRARDGARVDVLRFLPRPTRHLMELDLNLLLSSCCLAREPSVKSPSAVRTSIATAENSTVSVSDIDTTFEPLDQLEGATLISGLRGAIAGIDVGMELVSVDDEPVTSVEHGREMLDRAFSSSSDVRLRLQTRPPVTEVGLSKPTAHHKLGITLTSPGKDVVIHSLAPGGVGERAGLHVGMIVIEVDGEPTGSHFQGTATLKAAVGNFRMSVQERAQLRQLTLTKRSAGARHGLELRGPETAPMPLVPAAEPMVCAETLVLLARPEVAVAELDLLELVYSGRAAPRAVCVACGGTGAGAGGRGGRSGAVDEGAVVELEGAVAGAVEGGRSAVAGAVESSRRQHAYAHASRRRASVALMAGTPPVWMVASGREARGFRVLGDELAAVLERARSDGPGALVHVSTGRGDDVVLDLGAMRHIHVGTGRERALLRRAGDGSALLEDLARSPLISADLS